MLGCAEASWQTFDSNMFWGVVLNIKQIGPCFFSKSRLEKDKSIIKRVIAARCCGCVGFYCTNRQNGEKR